MVELAEGPLVDLLSEQERELFGPILELAVPLVAEAGIAHHVVQLGGEPVRLHLDGVALRFRLLEGPLVALDEACNVPVSGPIQPTAVALQEVVLVLRRPPQNGLLLFAGKFEELDLGHAELGLLLDLLWQVVLELGPDGLLDLLGAETFGESLVLLVGILLGHRLLFSWKVFVILMIIVLINFRAFKR